MMEHITMALATPEQSPLLFRLDDASLAAIRQIIREEIRQALADEIDADAARLEPRIVTVAHLTDEAEYYVAARSTPEPTAYSRDGFQCCIECGSAYLAPGSEKCRSCEDGL